MRCLICGKESKKLLCGNCNTEENVNELFHLLGDYGVNWDEYPLVKEYIESCPSITEARKGLSDILVDYHEEDFDFYECRLYAMTYDSRLEEVAINYLNKHEIKDERWQRVLLDLLNVYQFKDFEKPLRWCEEITTLTDLCSELYYKAAEYFAITGEYDSSEKLIDETIDALDSGKLTTMLYPVEKEKEELSKLKGKLQTYRTKRPYWPNSPEKRQMIAEIYDKKGINHPRVESKPKKVKEGDFKPIAETLEPPISYVSFWCREVFSTVSKDICEIGLVKMEEGKETGSFHKYIKPWSSSVSAVKQLKLEKELESAEDVDIVMKQALEFAKGFVMLAPGALDSQSKLIVRAARYAGISEIDNCFFDLLDYADEISDDFEIWTREKLLEKYQINDAQNAVDKARINVQLYKAMSEE